MRSDMPNRIYRGRTPPTTLDHVLAHPWELTLALLGVILGSVGVAATVMGGSVSQSVSRLPDPLVITLLSLLILGGVQMIRGVLDDSDDLMVGWTRERVGLVLFGSGWTVYAVALLANGASGAGWGFGLGLAVASGLRLAATYREERATRDAA